MKALTAFGIVLIALGAFVLAYPTLSFTDREEVLDAGPIEVTAETEEQVTIPGVVGGVAIAAGIGILLTRSKSGGSR